MPQGLYVQTVLGGGVPNRAKIGEKWQLVHYGCDAGIWRENNVTRHTTVLQLRQSAASRFGKVLSEVRLSLGDYPDNVRIQDEQTAEDIDLFNMQKQLHVHFL